MVPILVKIDTEGSETKILAGMQKLIKKFDDIRLVIEVNPTCLEANGSSPRSLLNQLDRFGFNVFVVFDVEMKYEKYIPGSEWNEYMGERTYRNVFCIKKDRSLNTVLFSHSALLEGADRSLVELATELIQDHGALCTVYLPHNGPLADVLENIGVVTIIGNYHWWCGLDIPDNVTINQHFGNSFNWVSVKYPN